MKFSNMNGYEFEDFIVKLFRKMGFRVEPTNYSGDGGIDLVAYYDKPIFRGKYVIECTNRTSDVGRILRTFKIKKNVEVTDNGKIII